MRTRNGRMHAYVVQHPYKGPLSPSRQKNTSCAFCPLAPHLMRALCLFLFGFTPRRARRAKLPAICSVLRFGPQVFLIFPPPV